MKKFASTRGPSTYAVKIKKVCHLIERFPELLLI